MHDELPAPRKITLRIEERPLDDDLAAALARDANVLYVDPDADEDDQLRAIRDAVGYLWTGVSLHSRPRLRLV